MAEPQLSHCLEAAKEDTLDLNTVIDPQRFVAGGAPPTRFLSGGRVLTWKGAAVANCHGTTCSSKSCSALTKYFSSESTPMCPLFHVRVFACFDKSM